MTDMADLMDIYKRSYESLERRHDELTEQCTQYCKRVAILEEEMDELQEAMSMMRPYLRER